MTSVQEERHRLEDFEERVRPHLRNAKERLDSFNERFLDFAREHPVLALGGAVFLGYLVARAAQRRR